MKPGRARRARVILAACTALPWAANVCAEQIPVFVFAGQSNMVGYRTDSTDLSAGSLATQANVLYSQRPAVAASWANMVGPTEINTPGSWPVLSGHGFGPELSAPLTISNANGGRTVASVKYAGNATNLYSDWNPDNPIPAENLYNKMLQRVSTSLSLLPSQSGGKTGYVKAIFWMQGEGDADTSAHANAYQANLTNFIARARQDLGDPNLPFIFGQISNAGPFTNTIRQAHANVAATVPNTYYVLTDDLPHVSADLVHLTSLSTYNLGIRFGQAFGTLTSNNRWVGTTGDWNAGKNWAGFIPDRIGDAANFTSFITSPTTVNTAIGVTVGSIKFDNANPYTIGGGGSITIDVSSGNGTIQALNGSHHINVPLRLNDSTVLDVAGPAGLTLSGTITLAAGTTITRQGGGAGNFNGAILSLGASTLNLSTGTTNFGVSQRLETLSISAGATARMNGGGSFLKAKGLTVNGKLDLGDAALLLDYSGASPIANVRQMLLSGAAGGNGIFSSTAAADRLAYAEAAELGVNSSRGESIDSTTVIISLATPGDADLNGTVDITDLSRLATAWQTSATWTSGDFNYDGVVDISDLSDLATHWQQSAPLAEALAAVGLASAVVPEPALSLLLLPLLLRRWS